jgi:hypothetical protein
MYVESCHFQLTISGTFYRDRVQHIKFVLVYRLHYYVTISFYCGSRYVFCFESRSWKQLFLKEALCLILVIFHLTVPIITTMVVVVG